MRKRLPISLRRAVDIQMIRIHRRHHRDIRRQLMKRPIVLIRLHHHILALLRQQQIRMVILAYSAQKRVHSGMAFRRGLISAVHQMRNHRTRRRLPMRPGDTKRLHPLSTLA